MSCFSRQIAAVVSTSFRSVLSYPAVVHKCCFPHLRDLQVFEEQFSFACPKFLSPVVPNYDNVHPNYHKEPFQQQLKVFAEEVQQQAQLSTIRR